MKSKRLTPCIVISLIVSLLFSCSAEFKTARQQGRELQNTSLLLLFPDTIFLTNSKEYLFPAGMDSLALYRASLDSSDFLKYIPAGQYLTDLKKQITELYRNYGFKVYEKENLDSFLALSSPAYVVEFGQLEIQEWWKPFHDEEIMEDDNLYTRDFVLNAVSLNCWTTISKLNHPDWGKRLVFTSYDLSDQIDGDFFWNNLLGKVFYDYRFEPLKKESLPELIEYGSINISLLLIDFIADTNIKTALDTLKGNTPRNYYRYIPRSKHLMPTADLPKYVEMNGI